MQTEMSQRQCGVISFSVIQNKYKVGKSFRLPERFILESHFTTAFYICSRKSRLEALLLFSSFEMYCCTEQQMVLKKQNISQEAYIHNKLQKSFITTFFTILLLISDTFRKYHDFLKVNFSLVLQ